MSKLLSLLKKVSVYKKDKLSIYPENFPVLINDKLVQLEKLLGYKIKDPTYYVKALTHRSFNEFANFNLRSNERLEYLGDSVLSLIIAEYLFKFYPNEEEGFLTKSRSKMVNRVALAAVAERIGLIDFMLVSNSFLSSSNGIVTVTSDAMEALIGAIFLDSGIESVRRFVEKNIITPFIEDDGLLEDNNFKSQLLEYAQANKFENPYYKVINEEGPHHSKTFTVEVFINSKSFGTGTGKNKKEAEQNAAREALLKIPSMKIE